MCKKLSICTSLLVALLLLCPAAVGQDDEVGYLRTRISPSVAGVFIDGKYYGTAAMFGFRDKAIPLKPGDYTVKIVDPRYKTLEARVKITTGKYATIRRQLSSLNNQPEGPFGELETNGFGNAAVYLNGKYYANTKELSSAVRTLLLKPGTYEMKIVGTDGDVERDEKITINADEILVISRIGAIVRRR